MTHGLRTDMATYVTYEELYGSRCSIESFRELLKKYQRSSVLYLCALINCLTRKWHGAVDKRAHDELASVAFKPALLEYLANHPTSSRRILFHRLQTLFVAKEASLYCPENGIDPLNTPHWGGFGEAFIMANDHVHLVLQEPNQALRRLTEYLSLNEYSSPCDLRAILARGNLALTRFLPPPSEINIRNLFECASGFGLDQFRVMCLGVITQYLGLDGEAYKEDKKRFLVGPGFFHNTSISQETVDRFLREMSSDSNELEAMYAARNGGPLDFTPFRDKPLIRIKQAYFPIDLRFLVEKLEAGVFWKVNASVDQKVRSSLHSAWGRGFESYSNWLLDQATDGKRNLLHKTPVYEGSKTQVTDGIIICGNKAIFLECKTAMIRSETKYGGVAANLAAEIHKKFVESEERPQGVTQLAAAINTVFDKEQPRPVSGVDLSRITMVYPVLLTKDSIGGSIGLSKYLRDFFKPKVNENALSVDVTSVFCLSIDQLEEFSDVLRDISFADLLYSWWRNDRTLGLNFPAAGGTGTRTQSRALPTALIEAMTDLFDETMTYFPEFNRSNIENGLDEGDTLLDPQQGPS